MRQLSTSRKLLVFFLTAILPLGLSSCQNSRSTGTASPDTADNGTIWGNPKAAITTQVMDAVCSVITRCNPQLTMETCQNGVGSTGGVAGPLNLDSNYDTLAAVAEAERTGVLVGSASAATSCSNSITQLQCSDPAVAASYVPASSNPFSGSVQLIQPTSCGNVLVPATDYACSAKVFVRGAGGAPISPKVSGPGLTYTVTPPLPAGLALNPATGEISGTPTVVTAMTTYTVTARAGTRSSSGTIDIKTAEGYLVDQLTDESNVGPGCRTAAGKCTLRAAIEAVNAGGTPNVIVLPAGQVTLTSGSQLSITAGTEIYGDCRQPTVLDGNATSRVLGIAAGPTQLMNLVVQNGSVSSSPGAGIQISASSANVAATLRDITVRNNVITGGSTFPEGAGIAVDGAGAGARGILDMSRCLISGNVNNAPGGHFGGGMSLWYYTQSTISDCSFVGNRAAGGGGGLAVRSSAVTISRSLFDANSAATSLGGAIYVNAGGGANVSLVNDTFHANTAEGAGAIYNGGGGSGNTVNILNSTFVNNTSQGTVQGGALGGDSPAPGASIQNSLFLGNTAGGITKTCGGTGNFAVSSKGGNLTSSSGPQCGFNAGLGDIPNTSAKLGALRDNGGLTQTMALLPGSPGIDQGSNSGCPATDQRGLPRPVHASCDIGAFEVQ